MPYKTADDWKSAREKRILLMGMSGLGKTYVSNLLREGGGWFHYSVDYRIGTCYMGEHIADNFKREAMKVPLLRELLMTDSIYVASNITFENLAPLSTYLGKPGDPAKGGLPFDEYVRRQAQHRIAERSAMMDTVHFIDRAQAIYGYDNFICDSSGSICEIIDDDVATDEVLKSLSDDLLIVWIEGTEAHTQELVRRFDRAPKPMCYNPAFLDAAWDEYRVEKNVREENVDPDDFVRWTYARALAQRQPLYREIADTHGVTVAASDVANVKTETDMIALVAQALEARG